MHAADVLAAVRQQAVQEKAKALAAAEAEKAEKAAALAAAAEERAAE